MSKCPLPLVPTLLLPPRLLFRQPLCAVHSMGDLFQVSLRWLTISEWFMPPRGPWTWTEVFRRRPLASRPPPAILSLLPCTLSRHSYFPGAALMPLTKPWLSGSIHPYRKRKKISDWKHIECLVLIGRQINNPGYGRWGRWEPNNSHLKGLLW